MKNSIFSQVVAHAYSFYNRLIRKIKYEARSFYQRVKPLNSLPNEAYDLFKQQQNAFFCSRFPDQPLKPNALSLKNYADQDTPSNSFWYRLTGHAKGHYSLAIVNRSLAKALYQFSNTQTCFVPFDDGIKKSVPHLPNNTDTILKAAIEQSIPSNAGHPSGRPIVSIVHHYPVITDDEPADIRLILFFWEESSIPFETVSRLNDKFDAILVATSFVGRALRNSGCAKPIFVIPMGVDHVVDYSAPLLPLPSIKNSEYFRFLHVSSVFERKGPEFLLAAFIAQFNAEDLVELYIKTFPNLHNRIHEQLAYFLTTKPNPPRVIIDEADIPNTALQALYRSAHTLVLPTRGEGFNLPAAEALTLGLPVIVTGYGAQTDFCTTTTASLIPFRFDLSKSHLNSTDSCWVTPDVRALSTLMRQSVDDMLKDSKTLQHHRESGQAVMRSTYSWNMAAKGIANAVHWLTALAPNHQRLNQTLSQTLDRDLPATCLKCVSLSEMNTLSAQATELDALVLVFDCRDHWVDQAQYMMSTTPASQSNIKHLFDLSENGTILILELPPDLDTTLLTQNLNSAVHFLSLFDRIIVQTVNDLNQMLLFCEVKQLMLLSSHQDTKQPIRDDKIKNMIKGLQYDRLMPQRNLP
jgi:glycosyltransferase involved in cell wall biosynthesis